MNLIRQPVGTNLCGQACVATVCNITLDEAIVLVQTRGGTKTKHLKIAFENCIG